MSDSLRLPRGMSLLAAVAVLAGAFLLAGCAGPVQPRSFPVFDSLLFSGKPDLSRAGLSPIRAVGRFWLPGESMVEVNEPGINREMAALATFPGLLFIDVEQWPVLNMPPAVAEQNLGKLIRVADLVRRANPARRIGYYSVMPERVYWPIIQGDAAALRQWQEANRRTTALAGHVDVLFPSLYAFYDDPAGWLKYARAMLTEARRYHKPVYAFLWPEFDTDNVVLRAKPMPAEFWRAQLELCYELADGVVLWGGWQRRWDDQAPWWLETQQFIRTHPITLDRPREAKP